MDMLMYEARDHAIDLARGLGWRLEEKDGKIWGRCRCCPDCEEQELGNNWWQALDWLSMESIEQDERERELKKKGG